jgi:hypothetical protein
MPWIDNRETEIQDMMAKLYPLTQSGVITTLDRNPTGKLVPDQMPAVLLFEGPDLVVKQSGRNTLGHQKRKLSLIFELWVFNDSDDLSVRNTELRALYNETRKAAMNKNSLTEKSLTSVFTSAVPGVLGVGVITELDYINEGN